jgi:hypothetical protein
VIPILRRFAMAKGQRSQKEKRKPKKDKPAPAAGGKK